MYDILVAEEEEEKGKKQKKLASSSTSSNVKGQTTLKNFYAPVISSVIVKITKEQFKYGLVEMIVSDSVPFRFFELKGYKATSGDLAKKLGVSLDRASVRDYVSEMAKKERIKLSEELKGKQIFVKVDCATRIRTNYLGVNVQYVGEDHLPVIKTLCVCDTLSRHDFIFSFQISKVLKIKNLFLNINVCLKQISFLAISNFLALVV